jgi:hypothetical protein
MQSPRQIAARRGRKVTDIIGNKAKATAETEDAVKEE